ncbi:MAG: CerR family C-terminal domain-containing protein [Pseudomonadota bacterium]|nr:CerR family C-terminal domain-containing protein [Pseudomonadota bacterium]
MEPLNPHLADETRKTRSDGAQSRERLLLAAMRLFAEHGFATTSTREIALAAGTNVASISYYFGDKAGLYRAAFTEHEARQSDDLSAFTAPGLPLRASLQAFYANLLGRLKQGDKARLGMRLWYREMLEPTGLWLEKIDHGIKPAHAGLVLVLGRHMGIAEPGDDIARLAFCVVGLAIQMMVTRDVIDQLTPQLLGSDAAIDTWMARLVDYAEAMVNAEQALQARQAAAQAPRKTPPRKKQA